MKTLTLFIFLIAFTGGFNDIATVNALKKEAKEAYTNGEYELALAKYKLLRDSLQVMDDNINLNLANAYFKTNDTTNAINEYSSLLASKDRGVKSVAQQQMGVIKNRQKKFTEALDHFKEALKANPNNEDARYNYEMLKKALKEQEKQNQEQNQDQQNKEQDKQDDQNKQDQNKEQEQNQDQQNKEQEKQQDQQNEENKEGEQNEDQEKEGEKKENEEQKGEEKEEEQKEAEEQEGEPKEEQSEEQQPSFSDKLKEMKISEEKAKMILEAMKNNEIQYIQQRKKKAKKKKDSEKPDW